MYEYKFSVKYVWLLLIDAYNAFHHYYIDGICKQQHLYSLYGMFGEVNIILYYIISLA